MNIEEEKEELLQDLFQVGKTKSLGYLPLEEIMDFCGKSIEEMLDFANQNGLKYEIFENGQSKIESGALYLYDEEMLAFVLNKYQKELQKAGVPFEKSVDFITFIAKKHVSKDEYPVAYEAIGKAFNDIRFR